LGKGVYKPSHDTMLLVNYLNENPHVVSGKSVLEVGSGSGFVSAVAAKLGAKRVVAVDVAQAAAEATRCTLELAGAGDWDVVRCDLLTCFRAPAPFDVVIFNPPYLPCEDWEASDEEALSWCGGATGSEVVERFLEQLAETCKPGTHVLLVVSSLSGFGENAEGLASAGFRVAKEQRFFFEKILLLEGAVGL